MIIKTDGTRIGSLPIRNTAVLITPKTKICLLVYASPKIGKTTLCATLDTMTKKFFGKPTLIIACETADGGGTMSIQEFGVDFVQPTNRDELLSVIAALGSDTTYGGVAVDSFSEVARSLIQPYALNFPARVGEPRRAAGVPEISDYHTMGEDARKILNQLVALTVHPNLNIRKHLIVTALSKTKYDKGGNTIIRVCPDLPGQMADTATAVFQTVGTIQVKVKVIKEEERIRQVKERYLVTEGDGVVILGDRTKCFPDEGTLDMVKIWEEGFVPRIAKVAMA